mmetsp:Transcript_4272/g.9956  ORF Transcript_4272/g.9956 Transcript_4272/m.9956 type:complete len:106 (+) Transcript_4272:273-590(+)
MTRRNQRKASRISCMWTLIEKVMLQSQSKVMESLVLTLSVLAVAWICRPPKFPSQQCKDLACRLLDEGWGPCLPSAKQARAQTGCSGQVPLSCRLMTLERARQDV